MSKIFSSLVLVTCGVLAGCAGGPKPGSYGSYPVWEALGAWDAAVPGCYEQGLLENPYGWPDQRRTVANYQKYATWYKRKYPANVEAYHDGQGWWKQQVKQGTTWTACQKINEQYSSVEAFLYKATWVGGGKNAGRAEGGEAAPASSADWTHVIVW